MVFALVVLLAVLAPPAHAARVKDVASLYGVRDNALFGYGLVTGLNRTGDSQRNAAMIRSLANRLQGLGVTLDPGEIAARNVAVVMVTARLPSSARPGHRLDVEVSSAGDARSLEGGILQMTPLYAPNGDAYASAQGPLVIGGYTVNTGGNETRKNHPTVGRVPRGGIVELDNPNRLALGQATTLEWLVDHPDFTTATRMAEAIDAAVGEEVSAARDEGTVVVAVPETWRAKIADYIALIEAVNVTVDAPARVVINERTGTVVMGADVTVSAVAVAHGGLSIEVQRTFDVSQPNVLGRGQTTVVPNTNVSVDEGSGHLKVIEGVTIGELVGALNDMGTSPRDLIEILLTIRAAGALQAEVEVL